MSRYQEEALKLKNALLKDPFPYWLGGILLGVLNIAHFAAFGAPWGITTAFANWGAWLGKALFGLHPENWAFYQSEANAKMLAGGFLNDGGSILDVGIILGALLATLLASQFRIKKIKNFKQVIGAVAGGLLMGYGARLSMGCNIGAFFSGTAEMSLHGWLFAIFLPVGAFFGSKILTKYLI